MKNRPPDMDHMMPSDDDNGPKRGGSTSVLHSDANTFHDACIQPPRGSSPEHFKTLRLTSDMIGNVGSTHQADPPPDPDRVLADSGSQHRLPYPHSLRGTPLGRYTAIKRIGRGGLGTVFLCHARGAYGFARRVAVKVLRADVADDERSIRPLLHEAYIGSLVRHPNLVSCLDLGAHERQPYLVMDFVDGNTLAELLEIRAAPVPFDICLRIIMDALCGLQALHSLCDEHGDPLDVIHCDVSPQNLLISTDGYTRLIDMSGARSRIAHPNPIHTDGHTAYLAPERIRSQHFDHRADLFSLGVVFHEALTGQRLFWSPDQNQILKNILHGPIPLPSMANHLTPSSADDLCLRLLARDPVIRFPSARSALLASHRVALTERQLATAEDVASWQELTLRASRINLRKETPNDGGPNAKPRGDRSRSESTTRVERHRRAGRLIAWLAGAFAILTLLTAAIAPRFFADLISISFPASLDSLTKAPLTTTVPSIVPEEKSTRRTTNHERDE